MTTRSRSKQAAEDSITTSPPHIDQCTNDVLRRNLQFPPNVRRLPSPLVRRGTKLNVRDYQLLQTKQHKLWHPDGQIPAFTREQSVFGKLHGGRARIQETTSLTRPVAATLVFAQQDAGTAVCIAPSGLILTCAHCVANSLEEHQRGLDKWLLFASGNIVRARCVAWDEHRDLALLQIVAAEGLTAKPSTEIIFPYASIASVQPKVKAPLLCIGHPSSEDLEVSTVGVATGYDVLHISHGRFRGLAANQDPQNNSDIGALRHDCWTYWGHSGAPLVEQSSGRLVGLHSSWDDETGMRRGVPLVAIHAFIREHTHYRRRETLGG